MPCDCKICQECGGSGYSKATVHQLTGKFHLMRDGGILRECESCRGIGKLTLCFECNAELEREDAKDERVN